MSTQNTYRNIDIKMRKLVSSLFVGNYKTAFQGRGMEFVDFREYHTGDDAKDIDWLVSAREGKTLLRRYREEREAEILFVFDITPSLFFTYEGKQKKELLEEIVYLLGSSILQNGDKLGAFFLS